jgi:hypothetical protein
MIIVDPITLGDTSFSRTSVKNVYNGAGTLVEVPPNTLGVTYDPADLSKAPWVLLEPAATNLLRYSEQLDNAAWGRVSAAPVANSAVAPTGMNVACKLIESAANTGHFIYQSRAGVNERVTLSVFAKAEERSWVYLSASNFSNASLGAHFNLATGSVVSVDAPNADYSEPMATIEAIGNGWFRCILSVTKGAAAPNNYAQINIGRANNPTSTLLNYMGDGVSGLYLWGAQMVTESTATSYIRTLDVPATRAADLVGSVAGLLYSNVPITEPDYSAAATYAKDALVHDPVTHNVFKSLIDANKGKALTDPAAWNLRGATNRWAMLDQYNNTQTAHPEEILIVLTPQAISEGLYIGNCDADEIELSVVDQSEGLVASEVTSLVTASGTSSYFDWCFRPADRSDYFVTTSLPPYANALVLIAIRKPGGVPKCGMLAIGAVDEFGPSLYGLSAEGKDYSSVTFNFDGTTNTDIRPFAKRMSVDVQVDNGEIDYIQRKLFQIRQRPIVWIGGPYGATAVFGRYGSFKIVIPGLKKSDMALQIEGSV